MGTEKASSELIVINILLEIKKRLNISFFSGIDFTVDKARGLNRFCDFIVCQSPEQLYLDTPVLALVEAKNENKTTKLLEITQNQKFEFPYATYTIADEKQEVIASLRKNHLYSLFRKRWDCFNPQQSLMSVIREDTLLLALLRRALGSFFGLLGTNFVILSANQASQLGQFNRKFTLLDRYVLDMSPDTTQTIDRRIALAIGVLLDTGERR